MRRMNRTQIYLEPEVSSALELLAQKRGTSKANLIRTATRRFLEQEQTAEEDPIFGLVGMGDAGPGRVSEEHDQILAGHSLDSESE